MYIGKRGGHPIPFPPDGDVVARAPRARLQPSPVPSNIRTIIAGRSYKPAAEKALLPLPLLSHRQSPGIYRYIYIRGRERSKKRPEQEDRLGQPANYSLIKGLPPSLSWLRALPLKGLIAALRAQVAHAGIRENKLLVMGKVRDGLAFYFFLEVFRKKESGYG